MKLTDFTPSAQGFASLMLRTYGTKLHYAKDIGSFYVYDGIRWVKDDKRSTTVRGLIGKVAERVQLRAADAPSGDKNGDPQAQQLWATRQQLIKLAAVPSSDGGRMSILGVMKDSPDILCFADDFARAPYLINFPNGTLDLRRPFYAPEDHPDAGMPNWNFVRHDPAHMLATVLDTEYKLVYGPEAQHESEGSAPKWEALLLRACDNDASLADSLEEALAYGLYGANPEQLAIFLIGAPATGKTQIIEIVKSLSGSLGTTAETSLIRKTYGEDHDKIRSVLRGKHFVSIDETDAHMKLDSTKIKQISGSDFVQTRKLHEEPVDTRVTWTLYVATNDLPELRGSMDGGVERRLWLFPMSETSIPEAKRNINLRQEIIKEEGPVILWRLSRKLSDWYMRKETSIGPAVRMHPASKALRDQYQAEANTVQEFATARLRAEQDSFLPHNEAFESYVDFCRKNQYSPEGKRKFTKMIRQIFLTESDKHSRFRDIMLSYEAPSWLS